MQNKVYNDLNELEKNLLDAAEKAMAFAYNPYSGFYVGSAFLSEKGQIFIGSNVENAAYGSTICAERATILNANSSGVRLFLKIALIGRGENFETREVVTPCGSCRQMIYEVAQISKKDLEVIMANTRKDKIVVATINELLPLGFGPRELGIDIEKYRR